MPEPRQIDTIAEVLSADAAEPEACFDNNIHDLLRWLNDQEPLGAEFESAWDRSIDKLYEGDGG